MGLSVWYKYKLFVQKALGMPGPGPIGGITSTPAAGSYSRDDGSVSR